MLLKTHQDNGCVEKAPKIKYSDAGNQFGVLLPLITIDPVGASCTPFATVGDPSGGKAVSNSSFCLYNRSNSSASWTCFGKDSNSLSILSLFPPLFSRVVSTIF